MATDDLTEMRTEHARVDARVAELAPVLAALCAPTWNAEATNMFEARAALYRDRFGRLAPGKYDALRNANDAENRAQFEAWESSGLAFVDALAAVVRLTARVESLTEEVETLRDVMAARAEGTVA